MEKLPDIEPLPSVVEYTPELYLAWRGLLISVKEEQITRARAIELLKEWACSSEEE